MPRIASITKQATENDYYRHVLATGPHLQVVIMSIPAEGEVGSETHPDNDQVLYLVSGNGKAYLDDVEQPFEPGDMVLVPAGTKHNFVTTGDEAMKIITTYGPAHHPDGLIQKTKEQADVEGD
jgi:mannose-6-phosphate isomerase-like protein (cupin superfamily)